MVNITNCDCCGERQKDEPFRIQLIVDRNYYDFCSKSCLETFINTKLIFNAI